jgi:hypothetical protein
MHLGRYNLKLHNNSYVSSKQIINILNILNKFIAYKYVPKKNIFNVIYNENYIIFNFNINMYNVDDGIIIDVTRTYGNIIYFTGFYDWLKKSLIEGIIPFISFINTEKNMSLSNELKRNKNMDEIIKTYNLIHEHLMYSYFESNGIDIILKKSTEDFSTKIFEIDDFMLLHILIDYVIFNDNDKNNKIRINSIIALSNLSSKKIFQNEIMKDLNLLSHLFNNCIIEDSHDNFPIQKSALNIFLNVFSNLDFISLLDTNTLMSWISNVDNITQSYIKYNATKIKKIIFNNISINIVQ